MTVEEHWSRYLRASHAMQSGVAYSKDKTGQQPKHLRAGINVALRDLGSLTGLLIAKGLITREELAEALADGMEEEAAWYAEELSAQCGAPVTLA